MICTVCGEHTNHSVLKSRRICQACYQYERNGGLIHAPSPKGTLIYDEEGNPICHICGQAHKKLGCHIYWHHGITTAEYKKYYKLNTTDKLTNPSYRSVMREHVYAHPSVIENNLRQAGLDTRYKTQDKRCTGRCNRKPKTHVVSFAYADTQK